MSNHIQELAKQAIDSLVHKPFSMEQFHEKFAELIVEDCIFVMKSTVDESVDFHRKLDETFFWVESDIKKHFGVSK